MDFLKDLFAKGPQVLPGATPTPSRGSDIANIMARVLGGAGAGMSAMEGFAPPSPPAMGHGGGMGLGLGLGQQAHIPGASPMANPRQDNIMSLLKRIFGDSNPAMPAQPAIPTNPTLPAAGIQGGTGGRY